MYLSFYGLRQEPFNITPDPDFLFLSPSHKEAFAAVMYGVEQRKGFVTLTGEVGTGKTTVLRAYLRRIQDSDIEPVYLFNPDLNFQELQLFLLHELGEDVRKIPSFATLRCLHMALIQAFRKDKNVVFIIDEAQNMPIETLEKLRMLSNLETTKEKLLQIVLVGQPELEKKLALHTLRQLRQRIAVHSTLRPLSAEESLAYIKHRLAQAGGNDDIFDPRALKTIVRLAKGIPRTLNVLCDNALINGLGYQQRPVTAKVVREAATEVLGVRVRPRVRWSFRIAAMAIVGILAFWGAGWRATNAGRTDEPTRVLAAPLTAPAPLETVRPVLLPTETAPVSQPLGIRPSAPAPVEDHSETPSMMARLGALTAPAEPREEPSAAAVSAPTPVSSVEAAPLPALDEPHGEIVYDASAPRLLATHVVAPGESLTALIHSMYGRSDARVIQIVKESNPRIEDPDRILVGDTLIFPEIEFEPGVRETRVAETSIGPATNGNTSCQTSTKH